MGNAHWGRNSKARNNCWAESRHVLFAPYDDCFDNLVVEACRTQFIFPGVLGQNHTGRAYSAIYPQKLCRDVWVN